MKALRHTNTRIISNPWQVPGPLSSSGPPDKLSGFYPLLALLEITSPDIQSTRILLQVPLWSPNPPLATTCLWSLQRSLLDSYSCSGFCNIASLDWAFLSGVGGEVGGAQLGASLAASSGSRRGGAPKSDLPPPAAAAVCVPAARSPAEAKAARRHPGPRWYRRERRGASRAQHTHTETRVAAQPSK